MSELTNTDRKIKENWYIACLSSELKKKPIQREIYDERLVLFRSEKKVVAQVDKCLHRYTKLSEGEVINGCLKCPYHGWTYNSEGEVVDIPSEGPDRNNKIVHRNKVFETIEQEGVIWVWMGEGASKEKPPWNFPKALDKSWSHYFMITDFDNNVTHLAENFMDVPHTVYVHKNWFRNRSFKKVPFNLKVQKGRVLATYNQENDEIGVLTKILLNPYKKPMVHTDEFIYPNLTRVDYTYGQEHGFIINSQMTPVSAYRTRVYTYISYKIAWGQRLFKPFVRFYTRRVIEQDVEIMVNQGSNLDFYKDHNFRSTAADEIHIAIEKLRNTGKQNPEKVFEIEYEKNKEFWI